MARSGKECAISPRLKNMAPCTGKPIKKETQRKPKQENRKASSFLLLFGTGIYALELDGICAVGLWFPSGNELINA